MSHFASAKRGRLLRLLFLRFSEVSAHPTGELLCGCEQFGHILARCRRTSRTWRLTTRSTRTLLGGPAARPSSRRLPWFVRPHPKRNPRSPPIHRLGGFMTSCRLRTTIFALGCWIAVATAGAQVIPDNIVVRPAEPTTSTSIQIDVPVPVCFYSDPLTLVHNSSMTVSGKTISISVDLVSFACFSAGDPGVTQSITFVLQRLPFGDYTIDYVESVGGIVNLQESATFTVSIASPTDIIPTEGMWWDPTQSGSGYAIDVKHGVLVMTVFSYTATGAPQWYLFFGPLTNNTTTAKLLKFVDGQCVSCALWQLPVADGDDGMAIVTFTSPTTATIVLPGGHATNIVPQDF